jgi:G:T-mismatch repair DNA endonuclease (very short patch repair protein)
MKVKCEKCGGEFDNKMFKLHVRNSHLDEFDNENDMGLFVLESRLGIDDEFMSKLIFEYDNGVSRQYLVEKYNITHKNISDILKFNGVEVKSFSEIGKLESVTKKREKTWYDKYGVTNVSKSDKIKEKKRKTFIENYGVDNIFKTDEFKDSINNIMIAKYGVKRKNNWDCLTDEEKRERIRRLNSGSSSILEKRIGKVLVEMGVKFEPQFELKGKLYDYHIKGTNILIEVNGDFWHANPKKYKASDILPFPKKEVLAESLWVKDEKKIKIARNSGYNVITLWEMDITNLSDIELELYIVEQINKLNESNK